MSKALYGYIGGSDAALLAEITHLRRRVRELEAQVAAFEADLVVLPDADLDVALRELGHAETVLT